MERIVMSQEGRGETPRGIVLVYPVQRIKLVADGEILPFKVFDPTIETTPPVDDKTLNIRMDEVIKHHAYSAKSIPAPNHPWRHYPAALTAGGGQLSPV